MKYKTIFYLFAFLVVASLVIGSTNIVNYFNPVPGSTITASRTIGFKFQTDSDSIESCWLAIGLTNGSVIGNQSRIGLEANNTLLATDRTSAGRVYNRTYVVPIDSEVGAYHNWSIYCGAARATASLLATKNFKLTTKRATVSDPVSGTVYTDSQRELSATTNVAITDGEVCTYNYTLSNGTSYNANSMTNSSDGKTWINDSVLDFVIDTSNGTTHSVAVRCNDTGTFYNSASVAFKVDTITPVSTFADLSVSSSSATMTQTIVDNNSASCFAQIYDRDGALAVLKTGTLGTLGETTPCTYTLTGDQVGQDGAFTVRYSGTDGGAKTAFATTNDTDVVKELFSGWNLITWSGQNDTMQDICNTVNGCTIVSKYSNSGKSYTTYTASTPTVNNDTWANVSEAVYIKVSSDTYLIMNDYLSTGTQFQTITPGWNQLGLLFNTSVNTILQQNTTNISFSTKHDSSQGKYFSCMTGLCTGTTSLPAELNLPKGSAAWVLSTATLNINRTGVSG